MRILVSGISGLGGHLAPRLLAEGHDVIGLSRDPSRVSVDVRVVRGDAAEDRGLDEAFAGVDVAYFLIHTYEKANHEGFVARDRRVATNFAAAARRAGIERIVYLGVPPPADPQRASAHMKSRLEVERILMEAIPSSVALRAFVIVSPRSRSMRVTLEFVRSQPLLLLPPWRKHRIQPMDVRDVFECLVAAATRTTVTGRRIGIAGPETVTFEELMMRIAGAMGLRRRILPLPFDFPPPVARLMARMNGGNPALIVPLMESTGPGDVLISENGAAELGVEVHPLEQTLSHAVQELRTGVWRETEGRPAEAVKAVA
jgi:uncharacterized protein YbjT (DUF2867 family)